MMESIYKYEIELNNIISLKEVMKEKFRFSNILLFREYQSRLLSWKLMIDHHSLNFFTKKKSFHNLFIDLSPDWIDEVIPEQKVIKDLNELGLDTLYYSLRDYEGLFISMFLNWKIFEGRPEIKEHQNLLNPYEPVFNLLLRGGSIHHVDLKFIIDNEKSYMLYDNNFKLPSLDEDFLEFVDRNVSDFPNQELVNELWEKFLKLP